MDNGQLLVSPLPEGPTYDLATMAAAINPDNNYSDVDFGRPAGSEIW